jgi:hypothetical protein
MDISTINPRQPSYVYINLTMVWGPFLPCAMVFTYEGSNSIRLGFDLLVKKIPYCPEKYPFFISPQFPTYPH